MVALVALVMAALPVVLDRCAESCRERHAAVADTPSCHHATSASNRIGQVPASCGHDHNATTVTSAKSPLPTVRMLDSMIAGDTTHGYVSSGQVNRRVLPHSLSASSHPPDGRSLPLRV
jgi:hypothetical protein